MCFLLKSQEDVSDTFEKYKYHLFSFCHLLLLKLHAAKNQGCSSGSIILLFVRR